MPELDDELQALRDADPIDPAAVPSSSSPAARALFEKITMTNESSKPSTRPSRTWLAAAAAIAVIATVGGAIALTRDDGSPGRDPQVATGPTSPPATNDPGTSAGAITPDGAADCVEQYTLATLAHRDAAFDGTVESVDGDSATFAVNHWYRGGQDARTIRRGAAVLGGITSAGSSVSLEPGTRLLVAGDDDFAWACGFTQPYDTAVASQWEDALRG